MGNQMFQWAAGRYLSTKLRVALKLDLEFLLDRTPRANFTFRDYDLDVFQIEPEFADPEDREWFRSKHDLASRFRSKLKRSLSGSRLVKERFFHFDPDVLQARDFSYLDGYWQSEKYFQTIEKEIRQDFQFREGLSQAGASLAREIRASNSICLNVRRGDFVANPEAAEFHGVMGLDYFTSAVLKLQELVPSGLEAFVFSDDIEWCEEHLKLPIPMRVVSHAFKGYKFGQYLQLMSLCKHFIIPNSSFAWWAAWLSESPDKRVFAPKVWFAGSQEDTRDLIPANWIRI
ncbi:MAG: alpha-1,2-fucosyltransferase [Candidatus Eremiobacteraeota bacterium]|nr:alpha-1,2-fucosyltransferase [Candidatus Eremiobacteraeota bacterium]